MDQAVFLSTVLKYRGLKAKNGEALWIVARVIVLSALGIGLSSANSTPVWFTGQLILGCAMFQWFILEHDAGHGYFFTRPIWNMAVGLFGSLFALVPFFSLSYIHSKHHIWIGWRDRDPSQKVVTPEDVPPARRFIVDFCWRFWVPIFGILFGLSNFWNIPRLFRMVKFTPLRFKFVFGIVFPIAIHVALGFAGVSHWRYWALAYFFFSTIADPMLISQHSHIPQNRAYDQEVKPIMPKDQPVYCRDLLFPEWFTRYFLLGFNIHAIHHMVPMIPSYRLHEIDQSLGKEGSTRTHWLDWFIRAKAMRGTELLLRMRNETGFKY